MTYIILLILRTTNERETLKNIYNRAVDIFILFLSFVSTNYRYFRYYSVKGNGKKGGY